MLDIDIAINFQELNFGEGFGDPSNPLWYKEEEVSRLWPDDERLLGNVVKALILMKRRGRSIENSESQLKSMNGYYKNPNRFEEKICFSGLSYFTVDETGDVYLCPNLPRPVGNVRNSTIQAILNSPQSENSKKKIFHCKRSCKMLACNQSPSFDKVVRKMKGVLRRTPV
ncbi:MAG: SPASM domain-containing protein [Fibrobacterota bacterium]